MKFRYLVSFVALCCIVVACKKKGSDEPQPTPIVIVPNGTSIKYGRAVMHLHTFIGDEELDGYNDVVSVPSSERRISMSIGNVYMSHFELVDMNNQIVKMCDTTLIKTPEVISYNISKIPAGKYKALRFKVEFDSTKSGNQLIDKSNLNPGSQYYAHFAGSLDSATTPDFSNTKVKYEYYIQPNAKSIQVALPNRKSGAEFNISESGVEYFHIYMDLNILFAGLKLNDPKSLKVVTVEENVSSIADQIVDNISNMFRYE
jgi:hypothetical protein